MSNPIENSVIDGRHFSIPASQKDFHVPVTRKTLWVAGTGQFTPEPFTTEILKRPTNYSGEYHMLYNSPLEAQVPDLRKLVKECYNDMTDASIEKVVGPGGIMDKWDTIIDLIRNQKGELVAFHSYRTATMELPDGGKPIKVLYTQLAGTAHSERGKSLTIHTRLPVIQLEQPDVIAGETRMPQIVETAKRLGEIFGYHVYPENSNTPQEIVDFGRSTFPHLFPAVNGNQRPQHTLENGRLTIKSSADRSERTVERRFYPLFDKHTNEGGLELQNNELIFYFGINPQTEARILGKKS